MGFRLEATAARMASPNAGFMRMALATCALFGLAVLCAPAPAAAVPTSMSFQGLLTDDLGAPLTQTVTLDFTLYDALTGGTSLWSETHAGTPVVDGLYDVQLGSITPLTPAILGNGSVFIEVAVDGELLVPRKQLLSVPYAIRAEEALAVGGVEQAVIAQIWSHNSFDGADPPNDDPREGLLDSDGDGIANFLESDNDDDGLSDAAELIAGTNLNVTTPVIAGLSPSTGDVAVATPVTVIGSGFRPEQTVTVDGLVVTPQNLTSSSFGLDLGPDAAGMVDVVVSDPGLDSSSASFEFLVTQPAIVSLSPALGDADITQLVTVSGSGFVPGLTVQFGTENPVPTNVNPSSFQVSVGPQAPGSVSVVVTNLNGASDSTSYTFQDTLDRKIVFVTLEALKGDIGGLVEADDICQQEANVESLPGVYLAWIATSAADQPNARFTQYSGNYELVDGTVIANDYADLTDGDLDAAISLGPDGSTLAGPVWTNVDAFGAVTTTVSDLQCEGWFSRDAVDFGPTGHSSQSSGAWSADTSRKCSTQNRLYCFQQ